jgi:hypothetical protein
MGEDRELVSKNDLLAFRAELQAMEERLSAKIEHALEKLERKLDHRFKITALLIIFSDLIIFLNAHKEAIGHLFKTFLNLTYEIK